MTITHRMSGTPTYKTWQKMRERCNNPLAEQYQWYGAKGVIVCDRWQYSFENFLADMGERPADKTIDRIESTGNYEPSNCRWATKLEQIWNQAKTIKVDLNGEMIALTDACERLGLPISRVYSRMKLKGMTFSAARAPGHLRETKTVAKLREYADLRKEGKSHAHLSEYFGVSESGLEKWSKEARALGYEWPSAQAKRFAA